MRKIMAALALVAMACGGGEGGETADTPAAAAPAAAAPAAQGASHDVQMVLAADGSYAYQPSTLTIKQGDRVRFINASGGPHNVAFYGDRIPAGAESVLNAAMANRMGSLSGGLLVAPNAVYEISFAGAPTGTYEYFCTPHEMLGMKASLTVTQ